MPSSALRSVAPQYPNSVLARYQGELIDKEPYTEAFLRLRKVEAGYDFSGLGAVIDLLIKECVEIAEKRSFLNLRALAT
jgi:hypothetical protein